MVNLQELSWLSSDWGIIHQSFLIDNKRKDGKGCLAIQLVAPNVIHGHNLRTSFSFQLKEIRNTI